MSEKPKPPSDSGSVASDCYAAQPVFMQWSAQQMRCQTDRHTYNSEVVNGAGDTVASLLRSDDAQFIAAGPDLAIACMALVEWANHAGDAPQMLDDAVELAKKAVRKAGMTNG